jgi:hypothetical protein
MSFSFLKGSCHRGQLFASTAPSVPLRLYGSSLFSVSTKKDARARLANFGFFASFAGEFVIKIQNSLLMI